MAHTPVTTPAPPAVSNAPPALASAPRAAELDTAAPDAPAGTEGFSADDAIAGQLESLERWATANAVEERRAAARFWSLHSLALVSAVMASATGPLLGDSILAVALAGLAALCVVVETAWSGAVTLGPAQLRALYELRELENTVQLRWDAARLAFPDPAHPKRVAHALALLDAIGNKREEIGKYLGGTHASPAVVLTTPSGSALPEVES